MTISDFDGSRFWPAVRAFVSAQGVEPISTGEPEDEIWRKIFAAAAQSGSPLSFGMTPSELIRAVSALVQGGGGIVPPTGFVFLIDNDGAYLVDDDGAYLLEAA